MNKQLIPVEYICDPEDGTITALKTSLESIRMLLDRSPEDVYRILTETYEHCLNNKMVPDEKDIN